MQDKDAFAERGRTLEEEYFRKKDRELIEKMKQAAAAEQARRDMGTKTGLTDPDMLHELEELGFTPETVSLLPLVPLVQMAWAEGGITKDERKMLIDLAHARGMTAGSPAEQQLNDWMARRPDDSVFTRATRLIRAMLSVGGQTDLTADDLVKYCEAIASASGGILGIIGKISAEERALLKSLASELTTRGKAEG
ncbi:MAG TPA: hypothetical protein VFO14_20505 [Vicinamibacterales bacterium]|nr:hypothetical protein [Vicinamibacterales bacterium]